MTATPTTPSCQSGAVLEYLNVNAYYLNLARRESDTGPQAAQQGRDGSVGKLAAVLPSRQANRLGGCECGCDDDGIDWDNVDDEFVDRELAKIGFFKSIGMVPPHRERDRLRAYNRRLKLRNQFGLTVEEYDTMFAAQGGVCAICRKPETAKHHKGGTRRLSVDHCHATGVNRGLLCKACNVGLGSFRDDPEALIHAATYLTLAELLPPKAKEPAPPPPPSIREVQAELDHMTHSPSAVAPLDGGSAT